MKPKYAALEYTQQIKTELFMLIEDTSFDFNRISN